MVRKAVRVVANYHRDAVCCFNEVRAFIVIGEFKKTTIDWSTWLKYSDSRERWELKGSVRLMSNAQIVVRQGSK